MFWRRCCLPVYVLAVEALIPSNGWMAEWSKAVDSRNSLPHSMGRILLSQEARVRIALQSITFSGCVHRDGGSSI